jgi:hypothetical protein
MGDRYANVAADLARTRLLHERANIDRRVRFVVASERLPDSPAPR